MSGWVSAPDSEIRADWIWTTRSCGEAAPGVYNRVEEEAVLSLPVSHPPALLVLLGWSPASYNDSVARSGPAVYPDLYA